MDNKLEQLVTRYRELGIDNQIDYDKFYLYSLITHSTAIEGSTITELENQIMFDHGVSLKGKSIEEQSMNLDLKVAYEKAIEFVKQHKPITIDMLISLSALVMKNTGKESMPQPSSVMRMVIHLRSSTVMSSCTSVAFARTLFCVRSRICSDKSRMAFLIPYTWR